MITKEQASQVLKKVWKTNEFKFIAEFHRPKTEDGIIIKPRKGIRPYGFLRNFSVNDRRIFYPSHDKLDYERSIFFQVDVVDGLTDGNFYYVELELEEEENRSENPYLLKIKNIYILAEDYLPPKKFIEKWFFKKGQTPEDASAIARQLKINTLELYTHTKRFIFELIQNADDMPAANRKVSITIHLHKDHLLFIHNGKFFNREDVKAISDAAKTTKSRNLAQTGYKGIGFKSVFTDSSRVFIKSGDYSFKFDKNEPIFKDFYALYSGHIEKLTVNAKKDFENEYYGRENEFTLIDHIPWQIKPIWVDYKNLPKSLSETEFAKKHNVAIALEVGENIIRQKKYHEMISSLFLDSRFLLFLRNTNNFTYTLFYPPEGNVNINIAIEEYYDNFNVLINDVTVSTFIKKDFPVNISDEDFVASGINFSKREVESGKFEFIDDKGAKLDNIPEKLGMLDKTILSLSARVDETNIIKLTNEESILFNYLPTSDQRFGFPFLVNADFVSKSDREFIQIENLWNHYLFFKLGQCLIQWIKHLAEKSISKNGKKYFLYAGSYLNLLPDELLDEENAELKSINQSFNRGLTLALGNTAFIIDANGESRLANDIILDNTGISRAFSPWFFESISETKKKLPHLIVNVSLLKKDYLNIETYEPNQLTEALYQVDKKELLSNSLCKFDDYKYLAFLKWLDQYYHHNDVEEQWLLQLPIIRHDEKIISLPAALVLEKFLFKTAKTIEIENTLKKIGFNLSEFSLDDEYVKNIKHTLISQNSYLNSDQKLFEHIIDSGSFDSLLPYEKEALITFFKELKDVGPSRYAKSLKLFKSTNPEIELKPLNSLISNECQNLPNWLNAFRIHPDEEKALSQVFQEELLQEQYLLEKLFCIPETFNEIIQGINSENIEDFYAYLLQLKSGLKEGEKVSFPSNTLLVYFESAEKFVSSTAVYWPDSITKLEAAKYKNVREVIETISDEQLPHFAALPIKAAFALGGNTFNFLKSAPKENAFDVLEINDFLDWIDAEGIKDFLSHFTISSVDTKFSLAFSNGAMQYYTTDESLVAAINESGINPAISLLPKELYSTQRNRIGLLEDEALLNHLLDNGLAVNAFAAFIKKADTTKLSIKYLDLLPELHLSTSKVYTDITPEFIILKLAIRHFLADEEKLKTFKSKITIDGHPLAERAISDDVLFYPKTGSPIELKTKLKEILPAYETMTYSVSDILRRFIDFRDDKGLTKIFKSESRKPAKIYKELIESNPTYYSSAQTFFLSYYAEVYQDTKVLDGKVFFTNHYANDPTAFAQAMHAFFDICLMENNYPGFLQQGVVPDFNPTQLISEEQYAIPSESLPEWLDGWCKTPFSENKKAFLSKMGIQDENSAVVLYRKAVLAGEAEAMNKNLELITNDQLLINSLYWLKAQQQTKPHAIKKEVLKRLYEKLANRKISENYLLFPRLEKYDGSTYRLEPLVTGEQPHLQHAGWGDYKQKIFEVLGSSSKITDDVLPQAYLDAWQLVKKVPVLQADTDKLFENSYDFDADHYQSWSLRKTVPIRLYKGRHLPDQVVYEGMVIETIKEKEVALINQVYYIVESKKEFAESYLEGVMPKSTLDDLKLHKQDLEVKRKKEEREITFTPEEAEAWKRLFGNEIPEDYYKDYNLAACVSALVVLGKKGYDVSQADANLFGSHDYAQVEPIFEAGNEEPLTLMCRSAKEGILYLTAQAWNRLDKAQVQLFVKTGKPDDAYYLFKEKKEVLEVSDTRYQVFRVKANSNAETTDAILAGEFAREKVWLILRMRENTDYKSIFEGGIKWNEENPDYDDVKITKD